MRALHFNRTRVNYNYNPLFDRLKVNSKSMTSNLGDIIEKCKAVAAQKVVDDNINDDCIVGIGSGSTMSYVLDRMVSRCREKNLSIKCIPSSLQAKQLIYDYKLPITELDCEPSIDVAIDGADEVDENFVAIKGGGACLAQEKVIAFAAKKFFVVADYRKNSKSLGENWSRGIPIEVLPMACNHVRHHICRMFEADLADLNVRIGKEKVGPVVTDNGNFIVDWKFKFDSSSANWKTVSEKVKLIPGVVETGIFEGIIKAAYFGQADGTVLKRTPE